MIDLNFHPSRRQLRQFSAALMVASLIGGALLWHRLGPNRISIGLWIVGPLLALLGWIVPPAVRFLFIGLSLLAFPIGFVIGFILLAAIYYLLITPIALVFKLMGRDPLHRGFDPDKTSYWVRRPVERPVERYFRQF